ncbi:MULTISPECIES: hypothetical protein [Hyphobacterium]|uniref:DUF2219 domain-containing protein n=1 Tax=Hyphobacterium vulgare TaxID=1736751 RepID=A0ABV6ZXT4_9PROT
MRRRTREILTAGMIAMGGIAFGLVSPASPLDQWDSSAAVVAGMHAERPAILSDETRRSLAGLTTRRATAITTTMTFAVPGLPEGANLIVEQQRVTGLDGEHNAIRVAAPLTATIPPDEFELAITPHAVIEPTPEGTQARFGADFTLGDGSMPDHGWFLFAAAERHALFLEPGRIRQPVSALDLQPYAPIGSAQAGIAYRIRPNMDLALTWVERDWAYRYGPSKWEADEDYIAASFAMTW